MYWYTVYTYLAGYRVFRVFSTKWGTARAPRRAHEQFSGSATAAYALKIPIPKIRACGGWSRRSQVPEDRYIDFKCPACDDGRRFFGWLTD